MVRLFLALLLVFAAGPAGAQDKLAPATVAALVQETNRLVKKNYLYPEKADAITSKLSSSLASGRYSVPDPTTVAVRMTEDFYAVTKDGHMNVRYSPTEAKALSAPREGPQPAGAEFLRKSLRATNFGISELKVLPGNVRYANVGTFDWDEEYSPAAFDEAIRFLRGGEAYILDIRANGGGSADGVAYLISHFMEPDRVLMNFYAADGHEQTRTLKTLPAGRLEPKPLYLLTSKNSYSAAEEFAAHVKNFKLGTTVGEGTGGGGNNNVYFATPQGFVVSISVGRAIHAVTGKGWEGEGIAADVVVPVRAALNAAHLEALKALRGKAPAEDQAKLDWTIELLQAKMNPRAVPKDQLAVYAGAYGNERSVVERGDKLYWQFGPSEYELLPLGPDLFVMDSPSATRVKFDRAGDKVTGATARFQAGNTSTFPRT